MNISEVINNTVAALTFLMIIITSGCGGGAVGPVGGTGTGAGGLAPSTDTYSLSRYFNLADTAVYDYDDGAKIVFGQGPLNLYPFLGNSYGDVFRFQFKEDDPDVIDTSFFAFSSDTALLYYGRYEKTSGIGKCVVFSKPVEVAPGTVTSGTTYTDQADFVVYNQCGPDGATQDVTGSISFSFTVEGEETIDTTVGSFSVVKFSLVESWSGTDSSSQSVSGTRTVAFWMALDTGPVRYENSDTGQAYHSVNTAIAGDTVYTSLGSVCGNGTKEMGEECDDGNTTSGDGCSSVCLDENLWIKTYGGTYDDGATALEQTSDGGFIAAGYYIPDGSAATDLWLLKLDEAGGQEWSKTFGGASADDRANSVRQTTDGGYIAAGCTSSSGAGGEDFWLLKVDSAGDLSWAQAYGGSSDDCAQSVRQTTDGGYIAAGYTSSSGAGSGDAWLLKVDSAGGLSWSQTYGGSSADYAYSVRQTADGGYVVAGNTSSSGAGGSDVWVLKLDASGNETWSKTYGASGDDYAYSIQEITGTGYIVAGSTESYGAGGSDVWVLLLNELGNQVWTGTFGDTGDEAGYSIIAESGGNYIVAGEKESSNDNNIWLLSITDAGVDAWTQTYGGSYDDTGRAVVQTTDGGFAVVGETRSTMDGGSDAWIMRTDSSGECAERLDSMVLLRQ